MKATTWQRHFLLDFPPRKTRVTQIHRTIHNILLSPTEWHLIPFHHPQRVYGRTEYADVITNFSRMDSLPNFLTHGAPLACASSARAPLIWFVYTDPTVCTISPSAESRKFGFMAHSKGTAETCHILIFDY